MSLSLKNAVAEIEALKKSDELPDWNQIGFLATVLRDNAPEEEPYADLLDMIIQKIWKAPVH